MIVRPISLIFSSIDAECRDLMDGLNSITFAYYTCKNLVVPSAFSTVDMALFKRNSYCFASDIIITF